MTEADTEQASYQGMSILCVDDERIILRSMQRLFHNKAYQVFVAENGQKALDILAKTPINVIISDMRMPEMDGPTLLEKAAKLYPDTYRIVLSGYADFDSTIAAVNLGKINRFINKPWNNSELVAVVEECLERITLKKENALLREKLNQQNAKLKQWNGKLEEKIELRTKQIRVALSRNERNKKALEKMLFNFIAINPNLNADFAKNVGSLAGRIALKVGLEKSEAYEIRLAGYLNELGLLGLDPKISSEPFYALNYEQKNAFNEQAKISQQILAPAQHLKNVSDIIQHQFLPLDEITQLNNVVSQQGCKILMLARDYWRYAFGKLTDKNLTYEEIYAELNKSRATKYADYLLDILKEHPELVEDAKLEQGVNTSQLEPGMLLKYSLYTNNNLLILAEGHEFTEASINQLTEYEKNQKHILSIVIEASRPV
ncbi:response regulator [Thalassotalea sp. PLHSN55]|uniref:response regulator n=1 Tax=Thalassotalea sp. PLHSN55 TaxID=3435888 RepID=UPI003F845CB9